MNKGMLVGIVTLVLIGGGLLIFSLPSSPNKTMTESGTMKMEKTDGSTMEMKDEAAMMKEDDEMMKKDEGVMMDKGDAMMRKGSYEAYQPEKLALAATGGDVLLFFHATWCPICRNIESELDTNVSKIPDGVHILKVDYDTATALRQKYGVTVQHTFVQVDSSGHLLQKFSDAAALSDVLLRIK
jgi:thioredoxin 1